MKKNMIHTRSILKMASTKKRKRLMSGLMAMKKLFRDGVVTQGIGEPSLYHAIIVIFLEFFAWGLLANPMITVLNETFPDHIFLMNGLIQGVKGILSFLSAPIIGALSDVWGRKSFLLITVFWTCFPIPLMRISPGWYFAMTSISGIFSVTFSVVLAYVADVTDEKERSFAYGLVSATFAASLITSPAIGEYLAELYSENMVIALASAVALLDVFFIMVAVPESLSEDTGLKRDDTKRRDGRKDRRRHSSSSSLSPSPSIFSIGWAKADPCANLRYISKDPTILMLCIITFLSYLPEAGQYSSFFVYLRLIMGFSKKQVASFIAFVGILSVFSQTVILSYLIRSVGNKHTVIVGLLFQGMQLVWYGFGSKQWMMWSAGCLAAISSITYPSISSYLSVHSTPEHQGLVQGMVTGVRGLCNGLGPALFGFIFYLFHVDVSSLAGHAADEARGLATGLGGDQAVQAGQAAGRALLNNTNRLPYQIAEPFLPGPPFLFGAVLVILALLVAVLVPDEWQLALRQLQRQAKSDEDANVSAKKTTSVVVRGQRYDANSLVENSEDEMDVVGGAHTPLLGPSSPLASPSTTQGSPGGACNPSSPQPTPAPAMLVVSDSSSS